eukprot:6687735-Prymnesium_polylepis.2
MSRHLRPHVAPPATAPRCATRRADEPASAFFDLTRLHAYAPLVPFGAFMRSSGGVVDRLWELAPPLGCVGDPVRKLERSLGEDGVEAYGEALHVKSEACEPGLRDAPLAHYVGAAPPPSSSDAAEGDGRSWPVVGLWRYRRGWLFGGSVRWPAARQADYWRIRRHVAFRRELHEAAAAFIDARLGAAPFLAVHWRRVRAAPGGGDGDVRTRRWAGDGARGRDARAWARGHGSM